MKKFIKKETFLGLCHSKGFRSMEEISVHFGFHENWLATTFYQNQNRIDQKYHESIRRIEGKVDYGSKRNTLKKYASLQTTHYVNREDLEEKPEAEPKPTAKPEKNFGAYDRGLGARLLFLFTGRIRKKRIK